MRTFLNLNEESLALNGGVPTRVKGWQDNFTMGEEEKQAALRVIESGYLSLFEGSYSPDVPFSFLGGPEVQALEKEWEQYYGIKNAVSMNSATSGLFAAIGALGLGYGDEVIVSPYTMTACALAPLIYGAIPIFADVEVQSGCLSLASIQDCVTERTRAILIVHQFGFPADMPAIMEFANSRGLHVIEDCAQAHGASINGQRVGTFGDIGVFSLNVNKTIQVGEGGICVTHDDNLAYRLRLIRNHGEAVVGPAGYADIVNIAGFNYRMTELQAGMAREQLKKLNVLNRQRLGMVDLLINLLDNNPYISVLTGSSSDTQSTSQATYYVVPLRFDHATAGVSRTQFVQALNAEGLLLAEGYVRPLYLQPLYQTRTLFKHGYPWTAPPNLASEPNYSPGSCPVAEQLHFEDLIISEHVRPPHQLTDVQEIASAINKVCGIQSLPL